MSRAVAEISGFALRDMDEIISFRLFHGQADAENFYSSSAPAGGQLKWWVSGS